MKRISVSRDYLYLFYLIVFIKSSWDTGLHSSKPRRVIIMKFLFIFLLLLLIIPRTMILWSYIIILLLDLRMLYSFLHIFLHRFHYHKLALCFLISYFIYISIIWSKSTLLGLFCIHLCVSRQVLVLPPLDSWKTFAFGEVCCIHLKWHRCLVDFAEMKRILLPNAVIPPVPLFMQFK